MEQTAIGTVTRLTSPNKAISASVGPMIVGLIGASLCDGVKLGRNQVRIATAGVVFGVAAGVAAFLAPPGKAEIVIEPGSLEILDDDVEFIDENESMNDAQALHD